MSGRISAIGQGSGEYRRRQDCIWLRSSREPAPWCVIYAGMKAVTAKSFAFIYSRKQVNNGLMGITLNDQS
jgi:hypothetical protein